MNNELNQRIALEVMGCFVMTHVHDGNKTLMTKNGWPIDVWPDYSGNIADAWLVVEELGKRQIIFAIRHPVQWECTLKYPLNGGEYIIAFQKRNTSPLAICHAALDICEKMKANP